MIPLAGITDPRVIGSVLVIIGGVGLLAGVRWWRRFQLTATGELSYKRWREGGSPRR